MEQVFPQNLLRGASLLQNLTVEQVFLQNVLRGVSLGTLYGLYIPSAVLFRPVSQNEKKWQLQTNFHGFIYSVLVGIYVGRFFSLDET